MVVESLVIGNAMVAMFLLPPRVAPPLPPPRVDAKVDARPVS